jgi:CTD small phosphatase-like protein 2
MRPYCLEFLKAVSQHYEVYIFTASNEDYAQAAMRFLNESSPTITGSLSRESCLRTSLGIYIKDIMRITNRMPHQMLLVDNLAYSFGHMIDNGIPVVEFIGDQSDKELLFLEKYLIECAKHEDLMKFNREHLKLRNIVEHLGKYF